MWVEMKELLMSVELRWEILNLSRAREKQLKTWSKGLYGQCPEGKYYNNSCVLCSVEGLLDVGNVTEVWVVEVGSWEKTKWE